MSQLAELAVVFPSNYIERVEGNEFVAHHVINQRLLQVVGPFDFELVREIRGDVPARAPDPNGKSRRAKAGTPALANIIVGAVFRLRCEIDGRDTIIEEIGDVGDVHNWPHDGARLKDAASDALKRCAMRLGLGLHLWAEKHYFLHRTLVQMQDTGDGERGPAGQGEEPAGDSATIQTVPRGGRSRGDAAPAAATSGPVERGATAPGPDPQPAVPVDAPPSGAAGSTPDTDRARVSGKPQAPPSRDSASSETAGAAANLIDGMSASEKGDAADWLAQHGGPELVKWFSFATSRAGRRARMRDLPAPLKTEAEALLVGRMQQEAS